MLGLQERRQEKAATRFAPSFYAAMAAINEANDTVFVVTISGVSHHGRILTISNTLQEPPINYALLPHRKDRFQLELLKLNPSDTEHPQIRIAGIRTDISPATTTIDVAMAIAQDMSPQGTELTRPSFVAVEYQRAKTLHAVARPQEFRNFVTSVFRRRRARAVIK